MKLIYHQRLVEYLTLILTLLSLAFLAIYVHGVYLYKTRILPEIFFWIFAVTFSTSIVLLWAFSKNRKIILTAIFVSAFVLVSMLFLRFYFYGYDLLGEYFVADVTHDIGRWTPERAMEGQTWWLDWQFGSTIQKPGQLLHRYFSTTSVTIFPAIISEVTGLSMRLVFWVLISVVSTVTVITGFLITRMCFGEKIASLSAIIFVFSPFYIGKFATILREDIALFFLLLAIFCILKGGRKSLVVSLISLMLLPMSHYGLVYFAALFLLLLFISTKAYKNNFLAKIVRKLGSNPSKVFSEHTGISGNLLLYSIVAGLFWLLFVAYAIFVANLGGFVESLKFWIGLAPSRLSYFQHHIFSSSLGPFHTAIQWLERLLAVVGLPLALKICRSRQAFSFTFTGAGLLATALALTFLPGLSLLFDLDRTMKVALLGFSIFIAIAVFSIHQKKNFGVALSVFFVTLFLLETLQAPILYSSDTNLSREEYIFSFTRVIGFYEFSDFQFAKWVKSFTNKSAVFASDSRGYGLCLIAKRMSVEPRGANVSDTISFLENGRTDYFLVLSYLPDYMSFTSEEGDELQLNSTEIANLLGSNRLNRIYDNSRVINFDYVQPTA